MAANDNEWSISTLKEYLESQIADIKANVVTARIANDKRLDSMNEFRGHLKDQQSEFLTRQEFDRAHKDLVKQVDNLSIFLNRNSPETLRTELNVRLARLEADAEAYRIYQAQFEDAVELAQWGRSMRANLKFLVPVALAVVSVVAALISSLILKGIH